MPAAREVDGHFLIVGDGPVRSRLSRLAKNRGVANRVTFAGNCSDQDLPAYYYASDLLVLHSVEVAEAFGLVQAEARACGIPVVSTDLPTGVGFVNQNGQTGLTVPPRSSTKLAEAINALLGNVEGRKKMGKNAQKRVKEILDIDEVVKNHLELYESLAGSSSGNPSVPGAPCGVARASRP